MEIVINHLYSSNLNIYGDLGNVIALKYWGKVLGINMQFVSNGIGDKSIHDADIYFLGGGQDEDQMLVYRELLRHKNFFKDAVENGKIFILICGGYQLFGKYFLDSDGNVIEGLNILDIETISPGPNVKSRCIGDVVVRMNQEFIDWWQIDTTFSQYLVGFENHGGQTYFKNPKLKPIGETVHGYGNNLKEKKEGIFYYNLIGSYLHGSLLPKNPHLAIAILRKALAKSHETEILLSKLDTEIEKKAHYHILHKCGVLTKE